MLPSGFQKSLQLAQNNAIRAIVTAKKFDRVTCSFKKLNILKFHNLCKLEIA